MWAARQLRCRFEAARTKLSRMPKPRPAIRSRPLLAAADLCRSSPASRRPSLQPQPPGLEIELICTASDADGNELLYKFLHQPPGAAYWKDLTGWQSRNWTIWRPTLADSGTNGLKVLVIDAKHAEKGSYDATATISYTIAP